jgi:ornithine cyclodeaminase/alanine dehydrogenase-like protein (mu-crystallin family)
MPIVITDEDAARLLSIPEAIEAMEVAFRDLAEGRAVNPPRLRYDIASPHPAHRYNANIHAGAVGTYRVACVRAGSHLLAADKNPCAGTAAVPTPSTGP